MGIKEAFAPTGEIPNRWRGSHNAERASRPTDDVRLPNRGRCHAQDRFCDRHGSNRGGPFRRVPQPVATSRSSRSGSERKVRSGGYKTAGLGLQPTRVAVFRSVVPAQCQQSAGRGSQRSARFGKLNLLSAEQFLRRPSQRSGFDIRYPPSRKSAKRMSNPKLH